MSQKNTGNTATNAGGGPRRAASGTGLAKSEKPSMTPQERHSVDAILEQLQGWLDDFDEGTKLLGASVLREVFDGDAAKMACPDRMTNPRLAYLIDGVLRDGRLSARGLATLLRVCAYDHLVQGPYWKRLLFGVKVRLLPLVDPDGPTSRKSLAALSAAAKHAVAFDLKSPEAQAFTQNKLLEDGRSVRRNARRKTYETQLERNLHLFHDAAGVDRLVKVSDAMTARDVAALEAKLTKAAQALAAAAKRIKGRGRQK